MAGGYAGKILRVNLTNKTTSVIDTSQYEEWTGGVGFGSALYWDLCEDKSLANAFDPRGISTVMVSPITGTPVPYSSRVQVQAIAPFAYPIEWFSRSNMGGAWGPMLKYAGWDGIVIEGKADKPVWVNIINDKVTIEDARALWGLDTYACQKEIWRRITGRTTFGEWFRVGDGYTTQGPIVMCIGPAGENLCRTAIINHSLSKSAGQGGFGAVWGFKNLKAISVLGTGSVKIANPQALLAARSWMMRVNMSVTLEPTPPNTEDWRRTSCLACINRCHFNQANGQMNGAECAEFQLKGTYQEPAIPIGMQTPHAYMQMYGLNAFYNGAYLENLYLNGDLGPGKQIDSAPLLMPIPYNRQGSAKWQQAYCEAVTHRQGIGADLAEGAMRAAKKWGRLEQDLESGMLDAAQWGYSWHHSLPTVESAYGSLMETRDQNEHRYIWNATTTAEIIGFDKLPADKFVERLSKMTIPYTDDLFMFDHNWQGADGTNMAQACETGIYSRHQAKFVAWHRHHTRFWNEAVLYCMHGFPQRFSVNTPDYEGFSPEAEPMLFNAVTGKNLTVADGVEIGRRIWNLDRAIWVMQGRHRDIEHFAPYMYTPVAAQAHDWSGRPRVVHYAAKPHMMETVCENGKWVWRDLKELYLDRTGVEHWKTHYYQFEGWDPETGWPTRKTLEELGLKHVADTLEKAGRLGSAK